MKKNRKKPGKAAAAAAGNEGSPFATALACGAVFAVSILYLRLQYPALSPVGDAAELSAAAALPGIAHPPGYPLYTMLGHLFTRINPGAGAAHMMNTFSAVWGALAAVMALLITARLTGSLAVGVSTALLLAFSPLAMRFSLTAEVFTLHLFLGLLLIWLLLVWSEDPESRGKTLALFSLVLGLSLSHHHTILLLTPAFLFLIIAAGGVRRLLAFLPRGLVLVLVGLLPYLYLPLRAGPDLPLNWGDPSTLKGFLWTVTRQGYGTGALFPGNAPGEVANFASSLGHFFHTLFASPCACFPFLAPLGLLFAFIEKRRVAVFFTLLLLGAGPLFLFLAQVPPGEGYRALAERFTLMPLGIWILFMGLALDFFRRLLKSPLHQRVFCAFCLLLPVIPLLLQTPVEDRSSNYVAADYGRNLLTGLDRNALLVTTTDLAMGCAYYFQSVERLRPDVIVVNRGFLSSPWYLQQFARRHPELLAGAGAGSRDETLGRIVENAAKSRTAYFDDWVKEYGGRLIPEGLCYRLQRPPFDARGDLLASHLARLSSFTRRSPLDTTAFGDEFTRETVRRYARVSFNLGWTLAQSGDEKKAEEAYLFAVKQDPQMASAWDNLGELYRRQGKLLEAEDALRKSIAIRPHAIPYYNLSLVYRQMGKAEEAQNAKEQGDMLKRARPGRTGATPRDESRDGVPR